MQILRTQDDRFADLADYNFVPNYAEVPGEGAMLRLHYVDEGPRGGAPVLLLHGQPSWSYLYRHMIPALAAAGRRVLAPDLVGFGRSDKPADPASYTYEAHVAWMRAWLEGLNLQDITLFCQDWGGLIGLRLVAASPGRFARVIAANTALPVGAGMGEAFQAWLAFSQSVPELPIGDILQHGATRTLTDAEVAAYDAPFPTEAYKAGARRFPVLVPVSPDHASVAENKAAWQVLQQFDKPFVTAFSDNDPITAGGEKIFQAKIPGAAGQRHVTIAGAGHFLQEDAPDRLVEVILERK